MLLQKLSLLDVATDIILHQTRLTETQPSRHGHKKHKTFPIPKITIKRITYSGR